VEGRAAFARVWAIGNIDTICWKDSTILKFVAEQNEDRVLEKKWSYIEKGWLNYRTRGARIAAFVVAVGNDSCRIGIVAQGWVIKPMPHWLVKLAVDIVLPQILEDLEKEVGRRSSERDPKNVIKEPWLKKVFKGISNLFK
jgi:hypothetical protein